MTKRYLVLADFADHDPDADVTTHYKAGQEVELAVDDFARIVAQHPHALREMSPKTKRDWAPDEDVP